MLLTITTTHRPATDLGHLLHKHPGRFQSYDLSFGRAHAFYPEAAEDRCAACLLLDVDPVGMVRGKGRAEGLLDQYVNDRPYVAGSFLSVAISQVYGSALQGRCKDRPELASTPIPLEARLDVLPVRGGERFLRAVFEPLGYSVEATRHPLDERFPEWGESPYFSVAVSKDTTLSELLTHLYVLVPVFDNQKHYFVGDDETEKLLARGGDWLANHPEKEEIARRYLKHRPSLYREALARLVREEQPAEARDEKAPGDRAEEVLERPLSLHEQRIGAVLAAFERAVFEFARPGMVVLTTPNREYNVTWENVGADRLRHPDHRFEWTRREFRDWAEGIAERFGYAVRFLPIGPVDETLGPPTQMAVFKRG